VAKFGAGFPVVTVLARFVVSLTPSLKLCTAPVQHRAKFLNQRRQAVGVSESQARGFRVTPSGFQNRPYFSAAA